MKEIIAVFEMQMRHCILRSTRSAVCVSGCIYVCVLIVCAVICGIQWKLRLFFLTLSYCLCFQRWWEKLTLRWNGHPSWRLEPSQRKVTNSWYFQSHHISALCFVTFLFSLFYVYRDILKCKELKLNSYFHLDPHVKVEGKRANVLEAKKQILEVLETRVRAVTFEFHNLMMWFYMCSTLLLLPYIRSCFENIFAIKFKL